MEKDQKLQVLNSKEGLRRGLSRREMVQRLVSGVGAGIAGMGSPLVAASHPVHRHLADDSTLSKADAKVAAADWAPEFLDAHQNETLIVLADRIVPGSTRAQVNRFIDLVLSVETAEGQQKFINALSSMDGESLSRYGHPFKALAEAQQNEVLTTASTAERGKSEEEKDWSWFAVPSAQTHEAPRLTLRDHFENLKGWISGAYYSSEIGMRELGWTGEVFFESFPGCQHPEGHH